MLAGGGGQANTYAPTIDDVGHPLTLEARGIVGAARKVVRDSAAASDARRASRHATWWLPRGSPTPPRRPVPVVSEAETPMGFV